MELQTLGDLKLEHHDFQERLPLLVLTFISLENNSLRNRVAELFWMHKESDKQIRSLDEALRRLRRKISVDIVKTVSGKLQTPVETDVHKLRQAILKKNYQQALELYKGSFLTGIERWQRLTLSNELEEWIINTREELHNQIREAMLCVGEELAFKENFLEASDFAQRAFELSIEATYPDPNDFVRMHTFMLAAELIDKAEQVKETATELYDIAELNFAKHPTEARQRLTKTLLPENPCLVGRERQLVEVLELLKKHSLVTLMGLGGVGKSSLAIALAWLSRLENFAGNGVHFVALEALPTDADSIVLVNTIVQAMRLSFSEEKSQQENLLEYIADKYLLLVLDNFEHLKQQALLVDTLLSNCPNLTILVTSREALNLDRENIFELQGLPYSAKEHKDLTLNQLHNEGRTSLAAINLFETFAKKRGFRLTEDNLINVIAIVQLVEGLPLGICLAAAWAHKCPCEVIVENIKESLDFLSRTNSYSKERHSSLKATFDFSFNLLTEQEKEAFTKLAVFSGGFTLEAVKEITKLNVVSLFQLVEASLLRYDIGNERYSFHSLIHQYAQEKLLSDQKQFLEISNAHAQLYLNKLITMAIVPKSNTTDKAEKFLKKELENIHVAWCWAVEHVWHEKIFKATYPLERFCDATANYQRALRLFEQAEAKFQLLEDEYPATLGNLKASRAWILYCSSHHQEAIKLAQQALTLMSHINYSIGQMLALNTKAASLMSLRKLSAAQSCLEKALSLEIENTSAENTWLKAQILNNFAALHTETGSYEQAESYYNEALLLFKEALGTEDLEVASCLNNLARLLLRFADRQEEAKNLFSESLNIRKKILGPEHPYLANSYNNIAGYLKLEGEYTEAKQLYEKALAIREKVLGIDHCDTATVYNNFATVLEREKKEYSKAESYYRKALSTYEKVLGTQNIRVATICNSLAELLRRQRRYQEAESLHRKALTIKENVLDDDDIQVTKSLKLLAGVLRDQEKYQEAEILYRRALLTQKNTLKVEDFELVASIRNGLAKVLFFKEEYKEAKSLYLEALNILEEKGHNGSAEIVRGNLEKLVKVMS